MKVLGAFLVVTYLMSAVLVQAHDGQRDHSHELAEKYQIRGKGALPPSTFKLNKKRVALVVTDPQIDFLSPKGVTWGVVGESVTENNTVENIDRLFSRRES